MTLVSAIMPTRGRQAWAQQALECFLAQTWPDKELVIVDDEDDPSFPAGVDRPHVVHFYHTTRLPIPVKRNMAGRIALGEILMHFDSDDWSAPERMADQVQRLKDSGKAMTAYSAMLFYVEPNGPALKYHGLPEYGIGTSLCYRRSWWQNHPFNETLKDCEDNEAMRAAFRANQVTSTDAGALMVARVHSSNTSPKNIAAAQYRPVPLESIPEGFFR